MHILDAKVILTERDLEGWYASFERTIIVHVWKRLVNGIAGLDPFFAGPIRDVHKRWTTGWMGARGNAEMRAKARGKYREHYALVRRTTQRRGCWNINLMLDGRRFADF